MRWGFTLILEFVMSGKILFILLLILFSCSKKKDYENIKVFGHAATGLEMLNSVYHDNSKEAVEFALSMEGCDGVEIDLHVSEDGEIWLYHDENLESETNGDGCIANLNSGYLSTLNYKTFAKEKLVALKDLNFTLFNGKELILDLRHHNSCVAGIVPIEKMISKLQSLGLHLQQDYKVTCIISYQNWIQPFLEAGFSVYYSIYSVAEFHQKNLLYPELEGYIVKNKDFTKDDIREIKNNSKKVYIFDIRSPKGIRSALRKHPDALITDDIRATLIEKY